MHAETADFAAGSATWHTRRNMRVSEIREQTDGQIDRQMQIDVHRVIAIFCIHTGGSDACRIQQKGMDARI